MPICGIYKITNQINGKCYIGQSVDIEKRWHQHKRRSLVLGSTEYDSYFHRAIRKYGLENFSFEVLEECPKEELNEKETFYVSRYSSNQVESGYNLTAGGSSNHTSFVIYDSVEFQQIVDEIKNSKLTFEQIGEKHGLCRRTITRINKGQVHFNENEVYPLRPFPLVGPKGVREKKVPCIPKNAHPCKYCGKLTTNKTYCSRECQVKDTSPMEILTDSLTKEVLIKEIREHGYSNTAVNHGTCVKSIKKLCKQYGIPTYKKDFFAWYEEQFPTVKKDLRKKVAKLDTNSGEVLTVYESISVAAKENEIGRTALSNALNKKSPCICGGIKWKFV